LDFTEQIGFFITYDFQKDLNTYKAKVNDESRTGYDPQRVTAFLSLHVVYNIICNRTNQQRNKNKTFNASGSKYIASIGRSMIPIPGSSFFFPLRLHLTTAI
jgi:hypothetical protein